MCGQDSLHLSCADAFIQYFQRHLTHDPLNRNYITREKMLHSAKFLILLFISEWGKENLMVFNNSKAHFLHYQIVAVVIRTSVLTLN